MFLIKNDKIFNTIKSIIVQYFPSIIYCDSYDVSMNKYNTLNYCIAHDVYSPIKFPISQKTQNLKNQLDSLLPSCYFKYNDINFKDLLSNNKKINNYMIKLDQFEYVLNLLKCKKLLKFLIDYKKNTKSSSLVLFFAQHSKINTNKKELIKLFDYYIDQFKEFIINYNNFICSFYLDQINFLKEKIPDIEKYVLLYNNSENYLCPVSYFGRENIILSAIFHYKNKEYINDEIINNIKEKDQQYPFISLYNILKESFDMFPKSSIYDKQHRKSFSKLSKDEMYNIIFQLYTNTIDIKNNDMYTIRYIQLPMIRNLISLLGFEYNDHIYKIIYNIHSNKKDINNNNQILLKINDIDILEYKLNNIITFSSFDNKNIIKILENSIGTLYDDINKISDIKFEYRDTKLKFKELSAPSIFNTMDLRFYNINYKDLYYLLENIVSIDCDEFQYKLYQLLYYYIWTLLMYKDDLYHSINDKIKKFLIKKLPKEIFLNVESFCAKYNYTYKTRTEFYIIEHNYTSAYDEKRILSYTYTLCNLLKYNQIEELLKPNINLCYNCKKMMLNMYIDIYDQKGILIDKNSDILDELNIILVYLITAEYLPLYENEFDKIKELRQSILQTYYKYYSQNQIIGMVNFLYRSYIQKILENMKNIANNINALTFEDFFTQMRYYIGEKSSEYLLKYKEL